MDWNSEDKFKLWKICKERVILYFREDKVPTGEEWVHIVMLALKDIVPGYPATSKTSTMSGSSDFVQNLSTS